MIGYEVFILVFFVTFLTSCAAFCGCKHLFMCNRGRKCQKDDDVSGEAETGWELSCDGQVLRQQQQQIQQQQQQLEVLQRQQRQMLQQLQQYQQGILRQPEENPCYSPRLPDYEQVVLRTTDENDDDEGGFNQSQRYSVQ